MKTETRKSDDQFIDAAVKKWFNTNVSQAGKDAIPLRVRKQLAVHVGKVVHPLTKRKADREAQALKEERDALCDACCSLIQTVEQLIPEPSARGVANVVLAQARAAVARTKPRLEPL